MTNDNQKWTLCQTFPGRQSPIPVGDYASEAEAWDALPEVEKELREQASKDQEYDSGAWIVKAPSGRSRTFIQYWLSTIPVDAQIEQE